MILDDISIIHKSSEGGIYWYRFDNGYVGRDANNKVICYIKGRDLENLYPDWIKRRRRWPQLKKLNNLPKKPSKKC